MKKTFYNCTKQQRQVKITNRMLISVGFTVLWSVVAYLMLRVSRGELGVNWLLNYNVILLWAFIASAVVSIALYILSHVDKFKPESKLAVLKLKERFRNYAHMFLAVAIACVYANLAYYTRWLPIESAPVVLSFLKNITKSYYVILSALGIYGLFTICYHMYLYYGKKW